MVQPAGSTPKTKLLNLNTKVDSLFEQRARENHAPATAYGVIYQGELIHKGGFGICETENETPADANTVFRIASMTKSFAAAAILQLRDAGKIQLDTTFIDYVPEIAGLQLPTADSAAITVRQLLSMNAGFPQDDPWADRQMYRDDASLTANYNLGATFSSPPGTRFEYSNLGYMLLGRIITNVSGQPALDYMTEQLIQPLGMIDTVWNASEVAEGRLACPYHYLDEQLIPEELIPSAGDNAAFAGLFTTVADLAIWVSFFLDAWPPRDGADDGILKRSSRREMQRIWTAAPPGLPPYQLGSSRAVSGNGYGFGLFIEHNGRYPVVGHGGGLPGYGSYMCWSPEHQIGVVGLGNVRYARASIAAKKALALLIKEAELEPYQIAVPHHLQQAAADFSSLMEEWDDSLANQIFADNFFLDLDRPHWRARLEQLREKHGKWGPAGPLKPENWLRGSWQLKGATGHCNLWLSMTGIVPPQIQAVRIDSILPPTPRMARALEAVITLINKPTKAKLDKLRSADSDRDALWHQLQLAHLLASPCQLDKQIAGDGYSRIVQKLSHSHGTIRLNLHLTPEGKVSKFWFEAQS